MTIDPNFTVLDFDERRTAIESFGRTVTEGLIHQFENLLRKFNMSGIIDITEWTVPAVRALLLVCRDKGQTVHLKLNDRYMAIARYPEGSISNQFVEMIIGQDY